MRNMQDQKGRSRRRNPISAQFAARLIEMLESAAYRALSLSAHRVLARIAIEHAHHGGEDNGRLPVTFENFQGYGMDRDAIAPAIRELDALGFIEITERGCAGNAEFRRPNLFRLTYRDCKGVAGDGTHEWRRIKTPDDADAIAVAARITPSKNRTSVGRNRIARSGNSPPKPKIASRDNPDYLDSRKSPTTVYISGEGR
jgi:hypothetical protein